REVPHRSVRFVAVEDVTEDQPGALYTPDDVEVGVDVGRAATRTGMAHPGANHDVGVITDQPGIAPVFGGARLGGVRPLDVERGADGTQDVADHVGDLRGKHADARIRLPFLEDFSLAVDHLEDYGRLVVDAA